MRDTCASMIRRLVGSFELNTTRFVPSTNDKVSGASAMDIKTVFDMVESGVKVAAIIIGGGWTYWKFVIQRANEPATDLDLDVNFVGKQDAKWIIEITVTLENKSQVRLRYQEFQITARYLLRGDKVEDGEGQKLNYQLSAPRTIDDRIGDKKRFFSNVEYINPKQVFRQRYITYIPGDAAFLWIQTKFFFRLKGKEKVNSQRIFRVPDDTITAATGAQTH